jgi:hypothetical protein
MDAPSKPPSITKQVVILLFGGLILSVGSCAGFLGTAGGSNPIAFVFAIGFVASVLMMIATVVWAVSRARRND